MAMHNPVGRANYQPNSWGEGPRETPKGFRSFPEPVEGDKQRIRPESFADHYSQARLFYVSQTPTEQTHIANALSFELAKVERPDIRARVVSHLRNIHDDLAKTVANKLGLASLPKPADAAVRASPGSEALPDLEHSQAWSETLRRPQARHLLSDGVEFETLGIALQKAIEKAGGTIEVVAPRIGGITADDGTLIEAKQAIEGGPSVLYDAVAILVSPEGAKELAANPGRAAIRCRCFRPLQVHRA